MKCTTVLHGGECHRTSTPHKSGNKMNKKKIVLAICFIRLLFLSIILIVMFLSWGVGFYLCLMVCFLLACMLSFVALCLSILWC